MARYHCVSIHPSDLFSPLIRRKEERDIFSRLMRVYMYVCVYCLPSTRRRPKESGRVRRKKRDLGCIDERESTEVREEKRRRKGKKATNIANHLLSVHMLQHRERNMVTTVVVTNIVDIACLQECNA